MDVLIIGLDSSILSEQAVDSDTRQRHLDYAAALERKSTSSHVYMIVHSTPEKGLEPKQLSENLTVYPTNTSIRYFFALDVLRIGHKICRNDDIDLVTTQGPFDDGLAGYLLSRIHGAAFLAQLRPSNLDDPYWRRERTLNRLLGPLGKVVCQLADGVRVVSETSREWCRGELGISDDRLYLNHISMSMLGHSMAEGNDVETEPTEILYVGRLAVEKDLPTLLKAFAKLTDNDNEYQLTITGDGPEREQLERLLCQLGIEEDTRFLGTVPYESLPEYYSRAAVVVLPSLHENFGRVILEAFAFGTPVISTDAEGPMELIDDGETGLLVPKQSPEEFARALKGLLTDDDGRKQMGKRGRQYVRENFDPDQLVKDLVDTWIDLVATS